MKTPVRIDEAVKSRFLAHLALTGRLAESCRAAGASYAGILAARRRDVAFEDEVEYAMQVYRESIEAEIHRRGHDGWEEPVFYKGQEVATVKKYSDRLLELEAKRHIPEYRERVQVDANVRGGVLVVGATVQDADDWLAKHKRREVQDAQDGEVQPSEEEGDAGGM